MTIEPEQDSASEPILTVQINTKEQLLALCKRVDLALPAFGVVEIFPYVSSGAMSAASLSISKKSNTLRAVFEESIVKDTVKSDSLTDADWIVVARHFLTSIDADLEFSGFLEQGTSIVDAFTKCFTESSLWKESEESNKKLLATLERQFLPHKELAEAFQRSIEPMLNASQFAIPTLESLGYYSPLQNVADRLGELHALSVPNFDFYQPELLAFKRLEEQFSEIRALQNNQISEIISLERLSILPVFPDFRELENLTLLNSVVANAVEQTLASNAYFSSKEYLSPFRLRRDLKSRSLDDGWVDDIEDAETAIVVETLTNQTAVDEVVRRRLQQFEADKRLNELPDLQRRVMALEAASSETDFTAVLERFGLRVARNDYSMFWSEYGDRFHSNPEAIGKSLLGAFLEGHARGNGFVAHEIQAGEGFVDVIVFLNQRTYIVELKVVGCGWGFGKAELGLNQLDYYDERFENAELFLVLFDGRKSKVGKQISSEYDLENGKVVKGISIPIYSEPPTSSHPKKK